MIRLVSCGIGNALNKDPIACAYQDAEQIYSSFQRHFPDFDNCYSVTLRDASSESFQRAIRNAATDLNEEDTLVIYFSGHADSSAAGEIKMFFRNGTEDAWPQRNLLSITDEFVCNKFLILDCCYAGEAISLSNHEASRERNLFVLAAVGPNSLAEYSQSASLFAKMLVECLDELDSTDQAITLTSIQQMLEKKGYRKSKTGISVGKSDLCLKASEHMERSDEFLNVFWSKLSSPQPSIRAIMWYALASSNLNYATKIKMVEQLYDRNYHFYEGSWIVRRAIGHLLGELPQHAQQVNKVEEKLLKSPNWMNVCIGLVATRNQNTAKMQKIRKDICNNSEFPMDVVWLANLYYADHYSEKREGEPGDEIFFPKQMCETVWGIEDLFSRYKGHEEVLKQLEKVAGERFYETFESQKKMLDVENFVTTNILLRTYLECPKIGRNTTSCHDKWLRVVLFGQWRDHPIADEMLKTYFESHSLSKCLEELKELSSAAVDVKLGILNYMASLESDKREEYLEALEWALTDPHPWVRRDAFELFSNDSELIKTVAFSESVNRMQYPGVLDMIIEANTIFKEPEWDEFLREYAKRNSFNKGEITAIDSYLK